MIDINYHYRLNEKNEKNEKIIIANISAIYI